MAVHETNRGADTALTRCGKELRDLCAGRGGDPGATSSYRKIVAGAPVALDRGLFLQRPNDIPAERSPAGTDLLRVGIE